MTKKCISDIKTEDLLGKRVLVRCDFNVPFDEEQNITDDTRIKASLPTISYLVERKCVVAICSHLGRPKNGPEKKYSLKPCAVRLGELLGQSVLLAPDCIGAEVSCIISKAKEGDVILLENTRFHKEESKNDPVFAKELSAPFDVYVNDAFGSAHRAHASTEGVTHFITTSVSGFLLAKELKYLEGAIVNGARPMAAVVGGSKVSTKIEVLNSLLEKCDKLIIGGGMVFTFFKAMGLNVGTSLVEDNYIETAKKVLEKADHLGKQIILPCDIVVADAFSRDANTQLVTSTSIPDGWMGLDQGPKTTEEQAGVLSDCMTIIMNGPMGVFEFEKFSKGTFDLIKILAYRAKAGAVTIIGGGDTVSACESSGYASDMSHVSTGGGASLELLEGKTLPGVAA